MAMKSRHAPLIAFLLLQVLWMPGRSSAQEPLSVKTNSFPKAYVRQQYNFQLEGRGGIPPFSWEITGGELPPGLTLDKSGFLFGMPETAGDFRLVLTLTDDAKPGKQINKELVLHVIAPLVVKWSMPPKITGHRIEGAIKVANETEQDFDLTAVIVAVNETGRATAIGYQRLTLKQESGELEIPFAENLPQGSYEVNVDVVGEVAETNSIFRARLTPEKLRVQQGP